MINIITGRPGSGKTYALTRIALDELKKGKQVYSNYFIRWEGDNLHPWKNSAELSAIKQGVIIMDEAQIYFNSRKWDSLDENLQYKLQQHRKDGLDIWGTVQHESRLDVVMRELVSRFFRCSKLIGSGEGSKTPWGVIKMLEYNPEDMQKKAKEGIDRKWFFIKKEFCDAYDTLEKISDKKTYEDEDEDYHFEEVVYKICKHCGQRRKA